MTHPGQLGRCWQFFFFLLLFGFYKKKDRRGFLRPCVLSVFCGFFCFSVFSLPPHHKHLTQASFLLSLSQPPVNLLRKDSKHFFLDFIISKQQGEEILVLVQPFNQSIVNVVKISKLKVFFGVVFGTCF